MEENDGPDECWSQSPGEKDVQNRIAQELAARPVSRSPLPSNVCFLGSRHTFVAHQCNDRRQPDQLNARNIAIVAVAVGAEIDKVAAELASAGDVRADHAAELLAR